MIGNIWPYQPIWIYVGHPVCENYPFTYYISTYVGISYFIIFTPFTFVWDHQNLTLMVRSFTFRICFPKKIYKQHFIADLQNIHGVSVNMKWIVHKMILILVELCKMSQSSLLQLQNICWIESLNLHKTGLFDLKSILNPLLLGAERIFFSWVAEIILKININLLKLNNYLLIKVRKRVKNTTINFNFFTNHFELQILVYNRFKYNYSISNFQSKLKCGNKLVP